MIRIGITVLWLVSVGFGVMYVLQKPRLSVAEVLDHASLQTVWLLAPVLTWGDALLGTDAKQLVALSLMVLALVLWLAAKFGVERPNKR